MGGFKLPFEPTEFIDELDPRRWVEVNGGLLLLLLLPAIGEAYLLGVVLLDHATIVSTVQMAIITSRTYLDSGVLL